MQSTNQNGAEMPNFEGKYPIYSQVPFAESAEVNHDLFGNVSRDVNLGSDACHAHIRGIRRYGHATLTAKAEKVKDNVNKMAEDS